MIEYFPAPDIKERVDHIIDLLKFDHVRPESVYCVRSRGSKAERTIARIHGLSRIWQDAMGTGAKYIIEIIAERFDNLTLDDQDRTLIIASRGVSGITGTMLTLRSWRHGTRGSSRRNSREPNS
jgi:predicted metallopeptidase